MKSFDEKPERVKHGASMERIARGGVAPCRVGLPPVSCNSNFYSACEMFSWETRPFLFSRRTYMNLPNRTCLLVLDIAPAHDRIIFFDCGNIFFVMLFGIIIFFDCENNFFLMVLPPAYAQRSLTSPGWRKSAQDKARSCFNRVIKRRNACWRPMNESQSMLQGSFFCFNKLFVSIDKRKGTMGTIYQSVIKHGARITDKVNDFLHTINVRLGMIDSSAMEAGHRSTSEVPGVLVSAGRRGHEHIKELCMPMTNPREKSPVTFKVLGSVKNSSFLMDTAEWEQKSPKPNPLTDIVGYANTLPAFIQGLPTATIQKHEVRMFPAPVPSDFAWLYVQGANPEDYDKYARAAYVAMSDGTVLKPRNAGAGVFLDDPDCFHMSDLKDPNSVVRDAIHTELDRLTKNGFREEQGLQEDFPKRMV